ncbi:alpha/beta hydrolase [Pseudooctadecabacter jejudonensis]|uniref:Putative acetyl-hydrolase LipR n=1 Tax=Pseudooctadecabacter jejudonensis TaxID=1391910 RepID=A0A1Y5T412_9RHOB|nr:alpha/beta hydrolase [Pseudooctadecabacter jejudonensis]SLN51888.1 Putative acetyl-hydrolase LipR precursor [Pseudooctadecabacter jejudonensis]
MTRPSFRLRALRLGMRLFEKPKLAKRGTPESANRDFERAAPYLFSVPKGTVVQDEPAFARITCGTVRPDAAILYLHGGAFVTGSRRSYRAMAARLAKRTGVAVYLPDYPKLQQAPFPAAPDAVQAAWDALLAQGFAPHSIVLAGDSAGGNLLFGLLATLLQRGEKPAAVLAFSPWTDMTLSGESLILNKDKDPLLPVSRMQEAVDLYLGPADRRDPRASPLFADFPDPPPALIQVGRDEVLFSDAARMADKLGGTLDVWADVFHVWQMFDGRLPEANAAMRRAAAFVQTSLDRAKR